MDERLIELPLHDAGYDDDKAMFRIETNGHFSFYVTNYDNGGEITATNARKLRDWLNENVKD